MKYCEASWCDLHGQSCDLIVNLNHPELNQLQCDFIWWLVFTRLAAYVDGKLQIKVNGVIIVPDQLKQLAGTMSVESMSQLNKSVERYRQYLTEYRINLTNNLNIYGRAALLK